MDLSKNAPAKTSA